MLNINVMKSIFLNLILIVFNLLDKVARGRLKPFILEKFQEKAYISKNILGKNITFFIPNRVTKWRVKTLFDQEPETIEWINSFEKDKIIFWDIGANIGLYSIYAACIHDNLKVVSFEPSTSNLRVLSRNISINNLENKIIINQFALTDHENTYAKMSETKFEEGYSMSTFYYQSDFEGRKMKPSQKYKIFGTSIDSLLKNKILDAPNYIKIDVDGTEHKILNGAKSLLQHHKIKSFLIEVNENYNEQLTEITELMKKNNFYLKSKNQLPTPANNKFAKSFNYIYYKD